MKKSTKGLLGVIVGAVAGATVYKFLQNKKNECAEVGDVSDEADVTENAEECGCSGEDTCEEASGEEECTCESASEEQAEPAEETESEKTEE